MNEYIVIIFQNEHVVSAKRKVVTCQSSNIVGEKKVGEGAVYPSIAAGGRTYVAYECHYSSLGIY